MQSYITREHHDGFISEKMMISTARTSSVDGLMFYGFLYRCEKDELSGRLRLLLVEDEGRGSIYVQQLGSERPLTTKDGPDFCYRFNESLDAYGDIVCHWRDHKATLGDYAAITKHVGKMSDPEFWNLFVIRSGAFTSHRLTDNFADVFLAFEKRTDCVASMRGYLQLKNVKGGVLAQIELSIHQSSRAPRIDYFPADGFIVATFWGTYNTTVVFYVKDLDATMIH